MSEKCLNSRITSRKYFFIFSFLFLFNSSFAQYDIPDIPSAPGFEETSQQNIFLENDIVAPTTNTNDPTENIYLNSRNPQNTNTKVLSPAQIANGKLSGVYTGTRLACPYNFERNLNVGSMGEDVRLLQVLLNSDRRTLISLVGAGSLNKETTLFGQATKEAVKKFQALFIEYIGIANGNFGPRTRTVMNAICNGTSKNDYGGVVYENVPSIQANATPQGQITEIPNDKIAPKVYLTANVSTIKVGDVFKVVVNLSEEVKAFTPEVVIIDGGSVKEIRKLSKTNYSISITPDEGVKKVLVQIEADKIFDLANNLNEEASNEVSVKISDTTAGNPELNGIVDKIVSSAPTCTYDNSGKLILIDPVTNQTIPTTGCPETKDNGVMSVYDQTNKCYQGSGQLPTGVTESQRCSNTQTIAVYDSGRACYSDVGVLPQGISELQRCSHPQNPNNPNNPNSVCNISYQQQFFAQQQRAQYDYGYAPITQNPCQNAQAVQAGQTAAQRSQGGSGSGGGGGGMMGGLSGLLGNLLKGGLGGGGGGGGQQTPGNPGPGPASTPGPATPAPADPKTPGTPDKPCPNGMGEAACTKYVNDRTENQKKYDELKCGDESQATNSKCNELAKKLGKPSTTDSPDGVSGKIDSKIECLFFVENTNIYTKVLPEISKETHDIFLISKINNPSVNFILALNKQHIDTDNGLTPKKDRKYVSDKTKVTGRNGVNTSCCTTFNKSTNRCSDSVQLNTKGNIYESTGSIEFAD